MIAGIITPGEWVADVRSGCVAVYPKGREGDTPGCHADDDRNIHYSSKGSKFNGMYWKMDEQAVNDALLFAEAGTVTNETGMAPRQLADRIAALEAQSAELLAALRSMLKEFGGDTGGIGAKSRCEAICAARAAAEKVSGSAS